MTIPPPLGSGNLKRMKRLLMQPSTAELLSVEVFVEAFDTDPVFEMTNFTVTFPPSVGFLGSSRW